jgi:hypothetical protein
MLNVTGRILNFFILAALEIAMEFASCILALINLFKLGLFNAFSIV